jgi:hypothetical protein
MFLSGDALLHLANLLGSILHQVCCCIDSALASTLDFVSLMQDTSDNGAEKADASQAVHLLIQVVAVLRNLAVKDEHVPGAWCSPTKRRRSEICSASPPKQPFRASA